MQPERSAASPSRPEFYLGSHHASQRWFDLEVPLFVSRRVLKDRKRLPIATAPWALDSGGFTELSMYGWWETTEQEYVADVRRFADEIGNLDWAAPQDWMCEPWIIAKTVRLGRPAIRKAKHLGRTVRNFLSLREELGELVIPVLQGWVRDDYHDCWELYEWSGVDLEAEPVVGLGSVCRRQNTAEAGRIVRSLAPLRLHYFGAKVTGLGNFADALTSADSMAWSYRARHDAPLHGCTHKSCANCPRYAMRWRQHVLNLLAQERLEVAA